MILSFNKRTTIVALCLTTLATSSVMANQEIDGEIVTVSSKQFGGYCFAEKDSAKLKDEVLNDLKIKVLNICGNRDYFMDEPRFFSHQNHFVINECDQEFTISGEVTVFCKN